MRILYLGSIIALTVLVGFFGFQAYALWVPLSTQQLLEQSKTIFVGNITAVTPVEVQYQSQIARNGTVKQSVGPETMTLDEYTVHVEEFLQNPQGYDTIKLRQATVGGIPTGPSAIGGFEVGDRVMFFLPKYENQTRFPMQYLPESFKIPQFCNGQDVLAQKRIVGSNNFTVIQNGLKVDYGNFTVDKPIKFLYDKDMNTLFGKRFDVAVGISKANDKGNLAVFSQEIHAGTKPCQWVTSAAWEFTPREDGKYIMTIITKEGNGTGGMSQTPFYVKSDTSVINHKLPLEQFKSGAPASNVKCNDDLQLIIKAEDGSPACVKPDTAQKLIERGWTIDANPLANDTGIVSMGNRTYYFETPHYSHDVYFNSTQISFHDVTFTLFPTGFRGGLPIPCDNNPASYQYYWTDAKFADNADELLHIQVTSPPCTTIPSMFSNHTNPQAGLTVYDGKMKLLVSTDVDKSSQHIGNTGTRGTIELQNMTYDFLVLNATMKAYHNPPLQTMLDGVEFTMLPGPWSGGPPGVCSGTPFKVEANPSDDLYMPLDIFIPDEPCKMNFTTTSLGLHQVPRVGLTINHGNVMILVGRDENNSGITRMGLKAYGFACCGLDGGFLKGNLSSSSDPIPNANVTISINEIMMGNARTYHDGCFQFNQWNNSKLSEQTSEALVNEKNSGISAPFKLAYSAIYAGDDIHSPASATTTSYVSLTAIPLAPQQLDSTVTPSLVNVTQGSSSDLQISVRPVIKEWDVAHMGLYLERLPCGISYEISQASDNNTSSTTHPAVFNVTLKAAAYSPEGSYHVGMVQNGTNQMNSRDVGTFPLNILKMR